MENLKHKHKEGDFIVEKIKKEKIKLEIIENLKYVQNLDILIFIKSMIDETNRLNKKEAAN